MSHTLRANSTTAHCMPRQMPRNGRARLAGVAHRRDLALDRPRAEATGNEDAVDASQLRGRLVGAERLGVDPVDLEVRAVVDGTVLERLDDREVGVLQLHVLADDGDAHAVGELVDAPAERLPLLEARWA